MKTRWISFIVLIVTLLIVQVVSYGEDEQTCLPDVIVLFGNGVLNKKQKARSNMLLLQNRLNAHISGTDLEGKIRYGLAQQSFGE